MHIDNDGHAIRAMTVMLDAAYEAIETGSIAAARERMDAEENRDKEPEE